MDDPKVNPGGGSGGGDEIVEAGSLYHIRANAAEIVAQTPVIPAEVMPCRITILAAGLPGDGFVRVRGSQGVRITAGPDLVPPTDSEETNGVEIICPPEQMVTISCGGIPDVSPTITVTSEGIIINAGEAPLMLTSLTNINLSVAEGVAEVDLAPEGVTITGPLVNIN
jgi:hypothetical protein